jgi:hypothetical protein
LVLDCVSNANFDTRNSTVAIVNIDDNESVMEFLLTGVFISLYVSVKAMLGKSNVSSCQLIWT